MPARDLILLAFFLGSLPVCFVRPFYGVQLWMIVAFLNPQSFIWGVTGFPWALAVAIPTIAGLVMYVRGWQKNLMKREVGLIIVLWLWFTVTSMISSTSPVFMHHAADTWARWQFVSKVL